MLLSKGNRLFESGNYEEAVVPYQEIVKLYPDYPLGFYNLANALAAMKKYD